MIGNLSSVNNGDTFVILELVLLEKPLYKRDEGDDWRSKITMMIKITIHL